ncbi:hypothetical protein INR49_009787 [Caranx melampygus]|nr:hypothetical protein INR49_009787 [Caranx melampygus]
MVTPVFLYPLKCLKCSLTCCGPQSVIFPGPINEPMSVHMDLDGACRQRKASQSLEDMEKQELVATGGRCFTLSGKPELQSMEGTLERKHKLQLGGKKAASRGWNSYHAVLYRHTLCFYQERKDTLRSSACGLPLNLMGAECSPAPEYTKKPNCFRLRNPSPCSGCHGLAKCHCSSRHDVTSTFPRRKPPGAAQTKGIVVLTREFSQMPQSHLRSLDEQSTVSSSHGGCCEQQQQHYKWCKEKKEEEALHFGTTITPPFHTCSAAKSHSVVLACAHAYTHAHGSYSSVWNGNSSRSCAFVVKICQNPPPEALITASQQSVNHYQDSIELDAV